ncbi:MAG TPA: diacylglycerol kinase family lipid kinase, partial [Caldithrix abyssi]|nr:diacylglycerol kinase family lipid kinase [Caldithrix abyssi]
EKGYERVIAIGGDGTVNEIASGLVNRGAALGIVPAGSGNGLARSLNIPLAIDRAFETALNGNIRAIDTGKAGEHYFFAVCGVGLDARIGQKFQRLKRRGIVPYFYFGLQTFLAYEYPRFEVHSDKHRFTVAPLTLVVSNGTEFGNGARIAPKAVMDDGLFDVCLLERMSLLEAALSLPGLFNGKIVNLKKYNSFRCRRLKISRGSEKILYHVDGEPHYTQGPLEITMNPNSLKVIV